MAGEVIGHPQRGRRQEKLQCEVGEAGAGRVESPIPLTYIDVLTVYVLKVSSRRIKTQFF